MGGWGVCKQTKKPPPKQTKPKPTKPLKTTNNHFLKKKGQKKEIAQSRKDFETVKSLMIKEQEEISEPVNSSSILNACDAITQAEYTCRPRLSFPANCPKCVFLQAGHEEKEKSSTNPDWKSKDKQCRNAPKKCAVPCHAMSCHQHLGQILTSTPFKKEKQTSLRKAGDVVKKKHGECAEPVLSTSHAVGSKDSKSSVFSHKENLKQKVEQEKEYDS